MTAFYEFSLLPFLALLSRFSRKAVAGLLVFLCVPFAHAQSELQELQDLPPVISGGEYKAPVVDASSLPSVDETEYFNNEPAFEEYYESYEEQPAWEECPPQVGEEKPDKPKAEKKKDKPTCKKSHKTLFFENDFSYLSNEDYDGCCLGDSLKQLPRNNCGCFGPCGCNAPKLDIGGQVRLRGHYERGMAQEAGFSRFQQNENEFLLLRTRLYGNLRLTDSFRMYAEGIFADVTGADPAYIPRPIDRNRGDFLNLFADIKLFDSTTVRIGRQELLFSAQRLISPLDWANTRRTFEGVRVLQNFDKLKLDWFYTNFVPVQPDDLDEADYDLSFYGLYSSYKGKSDTFDLYYIGFDNQNPAADFSLHTIGSRLTGGNDKWLYDVEGGVQFGRQSGLGLNQEGSYATVGVGRKYPNQAWNPTLWVYYDYASGNNLGGDFNRFNQLFPLAHKYLGFIDAVQRSNIESPNVLLTGNPTKNLKLLVWYHHFMSNQDTDIVPAIGGTPAQSNGSKDFGDEIDLIATYTIGPRSNLLVGYSRFWRGNKILTDTDADFAYVQWTLNF